MCQECVDALCVIFPEIPKEERLNFLICCTAFPAGDPELIRRQLLMLKVKMKTTDWRECFSIADAETEEARRNCSEPSAQSSCSQELDARSLPAGPHSEESISMLHAACAPSEESIALVRAALRSGSLRAAETELDHRENQVLNDQSRTTGDANS